MRKNNLSRILLFISLLILLVGITYAADNTTDTSDSVSDVSSSNTQTNSNYEVNTKYNNTKSIVKTNESLFKTATKKKNSTITVKSTKSVYVDDTVSIYGKLSSNSENITKTYITVTVGSQSYNLKTTRYGNYNLKIKGSTLGNNTVVASFAGSKYYSPSNASTIFTVSQKTTLLTLGSTKSAYVGDSISVYGKLSARSIGLPYKNITITADGRTYNVTTSKYGNYNIKVSSSTAGNKTITAEYGGTNIYTKSTNKTTFKANMKTTLLNLGSTKSANVGDNISVYGKLSARSIGLPYKNITITADGRTYNVTTSKYGNFNIKVSSSTAGNKTITVEYEGTNIYTSSVNQTTTIAKPLKSNIFANSIQAINTENIEFEVNITDELNNTVNEGNITLYLNNKKMITKNVSSNNLLTIDKQNVGTYDLKVLYNSNKYVSAEKVVKLTVNPKTNYSIKLINSPTLKSYDTASMRATVRNSSNVTVNKGTVKFYLNNVYKGSASVSNNLSILRNVYYGVSEGYHPVKIEYYLNNKFICSYSEFIHVNKNQQQIGQNVFITLAADLISNSKISSSKKDVYFVMDRTTASYDYSPNDMKIMNTIAYYLKANGFNVKRIKNGPSETYNTAKYMYNNNIKNSICFILCNGVDANVIREYLIGYDNRLTKVRNRGNDIVMGWFHGAGDIYNPDGEYYYWLPKAWDDNYSSWGGMSNPRKTAEKDGIKIIYEKNDLIGNKIAESFVKLYGGNFTEVVAKNTKLSLKTNLYTTNNQKISGNIVYTLNGKVIKNVTTTTDSYTFNYVMPNVSGTYNLKVSYYANNKLVCTTGDRYIKVS